MPRASAYASSLSSLAAAAESCARADSEEERCELRVRRGHSSARAGADGLRLAPLHLLVAHGLALGEEALQVRRQAGRGRRQRRLRRRRLRGR